MLDARPQDTIVRRAAMSPTIDWAGVGRELIAEAVKANPRPAWLDELQALTGLLNAVATRSISFEFKKAVRDRGCVSYPATIFNDANRYEAQRHIQCREVRHFLSFARMDTHDSMERLD